MSIFSVGDRVTVVGNTNDDRNNVGWCEEMDDMIGDIYVIKSVERSEYRDLYLYRLENDPHFYAYDEAWLSGVDNYDDSIANLDMLLAEYKM